MDLILIEVAGFRINSNTTSNFHVYYRRLNSYFAYYVAIDLA